MNILEINNLCITYQEKVKAVKNVSFNIPEKKIVAIVGESGSGKSTIIQSIIGLLGDDAKVCDGSISFRGKNMNNLSKNELRKIRGEGIGMIFQNAGSYLNPRIKIGSQYIETLKAHKKLSNEEAKRIAKNMLTKLKLADPDLIMKSYAFQLSGGMQQRVAIAMAISLEPKLLLADEPTSALDVTVEAQVVKELLALRDEMGTSIALVTHNMGVASKIADYIAVMYKGNLVEFNTRDEIIHCPKNEYTKMLLSVVPQLEEVGFEQKNIANL